MSKTIYIREDHKEKIRAIINEVTGSQQKKAVENIKRYINPDLSPYLDIPLRRLPFWLQKCLNPNGDSSLFNSVANSETNNRFIDFLRLNLYGQFGINRNSGPAKYLPGISRIACQELGFYSFDPQVMRGGNIIKLTRLCKLIDKKPEVMLKNITVDSDFNGMSYEELTETLKDNFSQYINSSNTELSSSLPSATSNNGYTITAIKDRVSNEGGGINITPTSDSMRFLKSLARYTDWCICGEQASFEYAQYTSGGGKFYILTKDGFENLPKEQGENCPFDEYGLSMIAVIVGPDGLPDNITTRWNHEFGGENHSGMWEASQLQKLTQLDYKKYFKPRSQSDLAKMHVLEEATPAAQDQVDNKSRSLTPGLVDGGLAMGEGAEPESDKYHIGFEGDSNNEYAHVIKESVSDDYDFKKDIDDLGGFMKDSGLNVFPYPKVKLNWSEQDGLFIRTGYYEPETKTVVLFCKDRHPKDILRSFAHEMIHHSQNLDGKKLSFTTADNVKDNKELEKLEAEAYLKGNIYFRKWTEHYTSKGNLNEGILSELTKPSDVDLSSFDIKKTLNPKFWKDERLDSRIRMKLLDIAEDFIKTLNVDWVKPKDIIMTGSLANYNWDKKYSDIDLHVLIDFSKVDKRTDFVSNYFLSQKKIWNDEHKDLKIMGFPIEVYVQDINEKHTSTGVYSIEKDKWIVEPEREKLENPDMDKSLIQRKVAEYIDKIDNLLNIYKKYKKDSYEVRKVYEDAIKIFDDIKKERRDAFKNDGKEMSNGNVIFKCLRRLGYIEKLLDLRSNAYDKMNTLS